MGIIVLYDNVNGNGNIVQSVEDAPGQNFVPMENRMVLSCKLYDVRPGCIITLNNSLDGHTSADFCTVKIKKDTPEYTVPGFDRSYDDDYVTVSFKMDGDVERVKVN